MDSGGAEEMEAEVVVEPPPPPVDALPLFCSPADFSSIPREIDSIFCVSVAWKSGKALPPVEIKLVVPEEEEEEEDEEEEEEEGIDNAPIMVLTSEREEVSKRNKGFVGAG